MPQGLLVPRRTLVRQTPTAYRWKGCSWASSSVLAVLTAISFSPTPVLAQNPPETGFEGIVLPIRVHILSSAESTNLHCTSTEAEISGWFEEVNAIWRQAGVRWDIESVVYEEANNPSEFDRMVELGRDAAADERRKVVHSTYPLERRLMPGWNIFFIRRMAFGGGVYNPETQSVLIGQTSPLGELNPSILAHELGHSLGLRHSQELYNLMAGRQQGIAPKDKIRLTRDQITRSRTIAESGDSFSRSREGAPSNR